MTEFGQKTHDRALQAVALTMADSSRLGARMKEILNRERRRASIPGPKRLAVGGALAAAFGVSAQTLHLTFAAALPPVKRHPTPVTVPQMAYTEDPFRHTVRFSNGVTVSDGDLLLPFEAVSPDPAWTQSLTQGATIELIGVSEPHDPNVKSSPDGGMDWGGSRSLTTSWNSWRPGGAPLARPLHYPTDDHLLSFPQSDANREVNVTFRVRGTTDEIGFGGYVVGSVLSGVGAYQRDATRPQSGTFAVGQSLVPDSMESSDVHVSVAMGPVDHVYRIPRKLWSGPGELGWRVGDRGPGPLMGEGKTSVTVSSPKVMLPGDYRFTVKDSFANQECRIYAVDNGGKRYRTNLDSTTNGTYRATDAEVQDTSLRLEDIDHLEIETRRYREVVFHNVALYPGRSVP